MSEKKSPSPYLSVIPPSNPARINPLKNRNYNIFAKKPTNIRNKNIPLSVSKSMRSNFHIQPQLGITPIEKIKIPTKSRDQLAPILLALQTIHNTPAIMEQIYKLLEDKILPGKDKTKGRPGLTHWQILVMGVVRNARACDYDQLEDLCSHHTLVRQFLQLPAIAGDDLTNTPDLSHKTISNNVCHITAELLAEINNIIAAHGRDLITPKKKDQPPKIIAKCDTYVLETNIHFPTDINLLWDAARKLCDLIPRLTKAHNLSGWRKHRDIAAQLKNQMRALGNTSQKGGANKQQRLQTQARHYLHSARNLRDKAQTTIKELQRKPLTSIQHARLTEVQYFQEMLEKHIDLIERRILKNETIPHSEKIFSLFEPHSQWIAKGKAGKPVELGRKLLITTDQNHLILDYQILDSPDEHPAALATVERLQARYGKDSIASISFDKGFSSRENKHQLQDKVGQLIMPKKGKRNVQETAEEKAPSYVILRHAHSAIESNINSLEHHGLDRCPDKKLRGYTRYTGLGILAYNLHQIGKALHKQEKARQEKEAKKRERQQQRQKRAA